MPTADFSPATDVYPITLQLRPILPMDDTQFFELCQINRSIRMERTAEGEIVIMMPAGGETGSQNSSDKQLSACLGTRRGKLAWLSTLQTAFILPNGATRSPDGSWALRSRLSTLAAADKKKFLPLCPDFVIELRSSTDRLPALVAKMEEYRENGVRLGWLIDPILQRVSVYTVGTDAPTVLEKPDFLSGDQILPGFILPLALAWDPGF